MPDNTNPKTTPYPIERYVVLRSQFNKPEPPAPAKIPEIPRNKRWIRHGGCVERIN